MSAIFTIIYNLSPRNAQKAARLIDKKFVALKAEAVQGSVSVRFTADDWTQEQARALAMYAEGVKDALGVIP